MSKVLWFKGKKRPKHTEVTKRTVMRINKTGFLFSSEIKKLKTRQQKHVLFGERGEVGKIDAVIKTLR